MSLIDGIHDFLGKVNLRSVLIYTSALKVSSIICLTQWDNYSRKGKGVMHKYD